jgi:sugar phosphate isomerase/epimerase
MDIGVIQRLDSDGKSLEALKGFGLGCCQLVSWDMAQCKPELAQFARAKAESLGVKISAFWAGLPGPAEWNFKFGPLTIGLVPAEFRMARVQALKDWADFAKILGAPAIVTHAGFLPENPGDHDYLPVLSALRQVAQHCKRNGIGFWFETGQETPVTLLRYIEEIGTGNLGINLDPANLLMYGRGNPVDAARVFGKYVRCMHAKDGVLPTDGLNLGHEKPIGGGLVDFPLMLRVLKDAGFDGDLIIEREIAPGEEQNRDIRNAVAKLTEWKNAL